MEMIIYLLTGAVLGGLISWLMAHNRQRGQNEQIRTALREEKQELERQYVQKQAVAEAQLQNARDTISLKQNDFNELKQERDRIVADMDELRGQYATVKAQFDTARLNLIEKNNDYLRTRSQLEQLQQTAQATHRELSAARAQHQAAEEKLQVQKEEIAALGQKFNTEFENIANKILETKTGHFTELNKTNLKQILEPLGENIREFKKQVQESYGKESNERFALQNEVKNLIILNQQLSREAQSLTRALKSESKTQGRWGEIILEKILDKSGLRKNEEFFMEHQLFDADGRPLLNAVTGRKLRPDALVVYPDNRHLIIDAKVSLTAFIRYADAEEESLQEAELMGHVRSVKNHINELHAKAYEDYDKAMDFVMMFIPNEAAYFAALKGDPQLWEYAYERRILLISPTNLIAALKLMADLWKRERNDRNSMEIAGRALKMYEKLVGFVENLDAVGKHLDTARDKYEDAIKQLHTGRDNFFSQAGKMKNLIHYDKPRDFSAARLDLGADNDAKEYTNP
ncbi:hypothetical protein GCM10027051_02030 [Niabella terrae]